MKAYQGLLSKQASFLPLLKSHLSPSFWQQVLLSLLSGGLMAIPHLNPELYYFAWVAFVPLLIAIDQSSLKKSYCFGLLFGLAFFASGTYWIVDFIMLSKAYGRALSMVLALVFWLYCAQLTAFLMVVFNGIKQRAPVHEFILFPLVVVTFFSAFPMLFSVQLGESQSRFLSGIQATEFVGVYGLDAMIALSNIILFRALFLSLDASRKRSNWSWLLGVLSLFLWFVYGMFSTWNWEHKVQGWETIRIGLVQPNEPPSLEKLPIYPGYSRAYPPEMAMTERLASVGAQLVVWPEARYKAYFDEPKVSAAYGDAIAALNTNLLFQDIERTRDPYRGTINQQYNTAGMLNSEGLLIGSYQKMKRVAFGEYVPLVNGIPVLKAWVEGFFGKFLNEMDKGGSRQFFELDELNVIPLICYETMFSQFVAESVGDAISKRRVGGILVGLSSNGWFGTTVQPYQHVSYSVLRAVENRLPLVHALNNGPSVVALPNGRIIFMSDYHQAGGYLVDVPYSKESKGSFFSRHPHLFINTVYGLLALIILVFVTPVRRLLVR